MKRILLLSFVLCAQFFLSQVTIEKNKLVKENVKYKFSQYEQVFSNPEAQAYFKKREQRKPFQKSVRTPVDSPSVLDWQH
ncbi:MAG TPA: hypothetical protein DCW95_02790 [Chryseobacterium sp.]|nr:hypothetical protein [Chryseobacterium sp.]